MTSDVQDTEDAARLLAIVRGLYTDVHRVAPPRGVTLDSRLDGDLGFDSLARVELLQRVEKMLARRLPDAALESAQTPGDLLSLLATARPTGTAIPLEREVLVEPQTMLSAPESIATLTASLEWHVRQHPERVQIRCLNPGQDDALESNITYAELWRQARALAIGLQERALPRGSTVAIMLPTSPDYFFAYFGVLIAGCVPVPIYPPFRMSQLEEHVRRHAGILSNAQARLLIAPYQARPVAWLLQAKVASLRQVATCGQLRQATGGLVNVPSAAEDIAFIQYTSGSTGHPKGVVLSHANLLANIHAIGRWAHYGPEDVVVSWLPLYHDMGLIAAWLAAMHFGVPLVVMPPTAFLLRPERWLWAIHRFRGTLTAAPNFAFELCLRRIEDAQIKGLDLSSLQVAANGSERVHADTIGRFTERFARYGFRPEAMVPVYGLAENTVGLAVSPFGRRPQIDRVEREAFLRRGLARPTAADEPNPLRFVSCGRPLQGHQLRLVDAQGEPVGERVEGRLEFRGPSATRGYYRNAELTRQLYDGDWLDSGDRAYMADGELYLTGRGKDLIIRGGRNIYPDEIEQAVGAIAGVRRGCVCAFGVPDSATGTERLVVLAETRLSDAKERSRLQQAVVRASAELIGEPPDEVVLAPPKSVLKTSSGKLRRAATRASFEAGLGAPGSAGRQLAQLLGPALRPGLRRVAGAVGPSLCTAYARLLFLALAPLVWLVTVMLPRPGWAWVVNRFAARSLLRLAGIRLEVHGWAQCQVPGPHVLVANHASYLDGLVLLAVLPQPYRFTAKAELRKRPLARLYLSRLGAEFVERFEIQRSVQDSSRVVALARSGEPMAFFPEGTFVGGAGLLPFRLGAFTAAVQASVPVLPVAIAGTRAILRSREWRPHRGAVRVTFGAPIPAPVRSGETFAAALQLRDQARAHIAAHCGEPDRFQGAVDAKPDAASAISGERT